MEAELNTSPQVRKAFWLSVIMGLVATFGIIFLAYQIARTDTLVGWQGYVGMSVFMVFWVCTWISAWLCRRQHHEMGVAILLSGLMLLVLVIPFIVTNRSVSVAILSVLLTISFSTQTLSDKQTNWWITISVLIGIIAILLDLWIPVPRITVLYSPLPLFTLAIVSTAFLLFMLTQYRRLRLRTKLLITFTAIPTVIVLIAGGFFLFNFLDNLNAQINETSVSLVENKRDSITSFLSSVGSDVQFLSQSIALTNHLSAQANNANPDTLAVTRQVLNEEFYAFAQARGVYDQIRFLDVSGQEIIRINTDRNGVSTIVPKEELQNKAGRYYFDDTMALSPGELMISPLDLNVEGSEIEDPYKPVIRYGTPVLFNGEKVGAIVVNVLADHFLNDLQAESSDYALVDADGYYLYHPDEDKRWGRELGTGITISQDAPELAKVLFSGTAGNFEDGVNYYAFTPVMLPGQDSPGWYLLNAMAQDVAFAAVNDTLRVSQAVLVISLMVTPLLALLFSQAITKPMTELAVSAQEISRGNLDVAVAVTSQDEFGLLAQAFNGMVQRLRESFGSLELRVKARTRDLALAAELGRNLSQVHDLDMLLQTAVNLIRERFDLYYTQIYLTNDVLQTLVLRAGTGDAGQQLLQAKHTLALGLGSINGIAAADKQSIVVTDTSQDLRFQPNPLLPLTRSEMAIPMLIGNRVVGVLNLQSAQANELTNENLPAFLALAGQLAIAIENARLFTETIEARAEIENYTRRITRDGWANYLDGIERPSVINYTFNTETGAFDDDLSSENSLDTSLEIPITVIDEPVGSIQIEMGDDYHWNEEDLALVRTVAKEVGQQIENLRLLHNATHYQMEAEKTLRRLTYEMWQAAQESKSFADGFVYDQKKVLSLSGQEAMDDPLIKQSLLINDEVIGELSVASVADIDQDEAAEITAVVANQLSRHLENLRLAEATEQALGEAQRRSRELFVLNRVVTRISAVNGLRESMQIIVDEVAESIQVKQVRIALFNEQHTDLIVIAEHYDASRSPSALGQVIPLAGNLLTEQVINTSQSQYVSDARTSPLTETIREMLGTQGIFGLALIPVIVSGEVVGTLGIDIQEEGKTISAEQLQLAEAMVLQAATAVDKARLFEQTEARAEELAVINQVAQVVSAQIDQQGLLMTVYEQIKRIMPVEAYFVALHNREAGLIEFPFVYDNGRMYQETPSPFRKGSNLAKVMESGEPLLINRTAEEIQKIILGQQSSMIGDYQKPSASLLYVPLRIGQEVLGVLSIHSYDINAYSQADTTLLMGIANHVAVALDNARLLAESRKSAQRAQILREITGSISSTMDAESILQTAAREIGRSLGLQTYVYLKTSDTNGHQSPSPADASNTQEA